MSLDVCLCGPARPVKCRCSECDHEHERIDRNELYHNNITHNLTQMADKAELYNALWQPDVCGIAKARQLIEPLRAGLVRLRAAPGIFMALNPQNGWGSYEGLVRFVEKYLAACEANPEADVRVSR